MTLRTAWTMPIPAVGTTSRDGGDPLGFRACANRLARQLVPGLTQTTSLARGFSVLCLGLKIARSQNQSSGDEARVRDSFLRFERLWVAAHCHRDGSDSVFPGKRTALSLLEDAELAIIEGYPLGKPILTSQLSSGTWGAYRRSAAMFGLLQGADAARVQLANTKLTPRGEKLATALRAAAFPHSYPSTWLTYPAVDISALGDIEAAASPPGGKSSKEIRLLTEGIEEYDAFHDRALGRLRAEFDHLGGGLPLTKIRLTQLAPAQGSALRLAVHLVEAIEEVEYPFRAWVAEEGTSPDFAASVGSLKLWSLLPPNETDLLRLGKALVSASKDQLPQVVLRHHRQLADARGAPRWEPNSGSAAAKTRELPDFTLRSAASLFREGVAPRAVL